MKQYPKIILSNTMTLDGHIDDASDERLLLSDTADFDRVDALRATCDAILVGANTIRKDNPRLVIRSEKRQKERLAKKLPAHPAKVTITNSGRLSADCLFFTMGDSQKIVFTTQQHSQSLRKKLKDHATVISIGKYDIDLDFVFTKLAKLGIQKVLVEGGSRLTTELLQHELVDEWYLSIAGFLVGDTKAPRIVQNGTFPWSAQKRMQLISVTMVGESALLHYKV